MVQRIVLIGPGSISRKYMDVLTTIEDMKVVGVVGREYRKAEVYAKEYGISHHGIDLKKVAETCRPTMALVCTPNAVHYEGVTTAAHLGLNVLCEKPLHISPQKQEEMIRTCRQRGVKLGVGYSYRFMKSMRRVKEMVVSGQLGRILAIDARLKTWREESYYLKSSWHGTPDVDGGGPFIQQGSHLVDLALWMGDGYREVLSAVRFTLNQPIRVEDHGYGIIRYGNGAVGSIQASTVCRGWNTNHLEISGTRGSVSLDFTGIRRWNVEEVEPPNVDEETDVKRFIFRELLLDFQQAVESDREPFINGESGKQAVELIDELYRISGAPLARL